MTTDQQPPWVVDEQRRRNELARMVDDHEQRRLATRIAAFLTYALWWGALPAALIYSACMALEASTDLTNAATGVGVVLGLLFALGLASNAK